MDSVRFHWIPLDSFGFQDSIGFRWIPYDSLGFHRVPLDSIGFRGILYTLKKEVLYGTPKKGSVDVEKLPNVSKESKKE